MSRNNVLEKYIIDLCSPTLASLKTASLINCYFINEKQLEKDMAELNLLLNGKGIKIQTLRKSKKSVLIYVYRIDMLAEDLMKPGVKEVLTYYGYDSTEPEKAIEKLKMRLSETTEFPHEIGLFLGYPVGDVVGFIKNKGKNFKCCGCWKVYCDQCEAERRFELFNKCTRIYMEQWKAGKSVLKLTVAAMVRSSRATAATTSSAHSSSTISVRLRSEERRVGKECRSRWSPYH